jgi:hypothetical protein
MEDNSIKKYNFFPGQKVILEWNYYYKINYLLSPAKLSDMTVVRYNSAWVKDCSYINDLTSLTTKRAIKRLFC